MLSIYISIENTSDRIGPESKGIHEPSKFKEVLGVQANTRYLLFIIRLQDEVYKAMKIAYGEHLQLDIYYLKSLIITRPYIAIFSQPISTL